MKIPSMLLKRLYTNGSLQNASNGVRFSLKNRLSDAKITGVDHVKVNGRTLELDKLWLEVNGERTRATTVSAENTVDFSLRQIIDVFTNGGPLNEGKHTIEIAVQADPFGAIKFKVKDEVGESDEEVRPRIPRSTIDDYSLDIIADRQKFVEEQTGVKLRHIPHYNFDPHIAQGNVEHFTGVAQIPMGFAGPLQVNGEYAQGEFVIPLATSEGTLIASYNRGIKLVNECGGVKCTVVDDAMQRAPVFVFDDARGARDFRAWCEANMDNIRREGEATSSVAKLQYIDHYLANKFDFLRFNFHTGDAAGQNMVGKATNAACHWIIDNYDGVHPIRHFYLESNFATDKKASQVNVMRTRGKRVVAEAHISRDALIDIMRVTPEALHFHSQVANVGAFLSGANNNGLHSANGITAMFIATGQDVANVAESSAGVIYVELTPEGDLYVSITIPSLIVATYGGGTGLATQRESLEILDCYGRDKVRKFAEIVAGVVLAGELSLAAAISASDWVTSHEDFGRNR